MFQSNNYKVKQRVSYWLTSNILVMLYICSVEGMKTYDEFTQLNILFLSNNLMLFSILSLSFSRIVFFLHYSVAGKFHHRALLFISTVNP